MHPPAAAPQMPALRPIVLLAGVMSIVAGVRMSGAQEIVGVTEVNPQAVVFSTSAGNVVASVGKDGDHQKRQDRG